MPYCPLCRIEYRPEISRCRDCEVELVDSLPEEPATEEAGDPVKLASFSNVAEAKMIQELLEDNGIATDLRGDVDPIGVISGVEPTTLLVVGKDLTRAKEIYDAFFAGDQPPEENSSDPEV
jgi:hypothetical protein